MTKRKFGSDDYQNLIERYSSLARDDRRKDVTFTFEGSDTKIKAHKVILEAASPVFETMFSRKFAKKDVVHITDVKPEIFQLLINGIYLNELSFNKFNKDVERAADLYFAADKYAIVDIRNISKKFMIDNCHSGNTHFLLMKAKMYNLSDLEATSKAFFTEHTYRVLWHHLTLNLDDEVLSDLFALETHSIQNEFELYLALEVMVDRKLLTSYSNCLSKIRFLTMDSVDVLTCDLLSNEEKVAVAANIEARKHQQVSMIDMLSHLSNETTPRNNQDFVIKWKQNFWTALLLKCDNVDKYLKLFYKFMDIPDNRMATMKTLIQRGRQEMPLLEHLSGEKFGSLTKSIFAYKTENTT